MNEIKNVQLSKKELELLFKWYQKGFTDQDVDQPLFEKLKKAYDEDQGEN